LVITRVEELVTAFETWRDGPYIWGICIYINLIQQRIVCCRSIFCAPMLHQIVSCVCLYYLIWEIKSIANVIVSCIVKGSSSAWVSPIDRLTCALALISSELFVAETFLQQSRTKLYVLWSPTDDRIVLDSLIRSVQACPWT
jgi:hypothetical protein